ncbi:G-D-S-L family lipolytic protein [Nodosilinea sp. LEGE 06152]|uniref:GDSL-type esterase/lipase family protein n=1 Tax=Nodosilinea sp. LEGE 06152 TaxID=2777966 RepID=UPI0018829F20|nr:GDSL-type esterase/lipase family protein [Nodosilinea sp. LEGE 06152]MBE9159289.1 G-D-S-L family lipolytic protein [Nodosilinea sp. LEGE 06152]
MAAIARWMSLVSISLNVVFLAAGVLVIARRGGWAYLQERWHRQASREVAIYQSPYYRHRQSQFEKLSVGTNDILFLGDSIIDEGEWSDWFPIATIRNRGISADTTSGVLRRLPDLLKTAPQAIFVMIGINDLIFLGRSPEQVLSHHQQMLTLIKQQAPQTQVYVKSVLPVSDSVFPGANAKILQLNQGIAALAESLDYRYVDLHALFVVNGQLDGAYTADGLHLNGDGYARWVEHLHPSITALSTQ